MLEEKRLIHLRISAQEAESLMAEEVFYALANSSQTEEY
jgi:hypothetical protein